MIDGPAVVAALEAAGFTHLVWIPDSSLGTWNAALMGSQLAPIRPCREGEAVGIAAGLMLGGARPLVAIQCTGFFEAGDAVRNVAHDLKLPLKMIVGVRSYRAMKAGKTADNCPQFAVPVVQALGLPYEWFDPTERDAAALAASLRGLVERPGPAVLLWAE
ncbi:MAG TPA: thiamine pyrophosphate-binding protein [Gemmataceae bacterium]|nr:thiamine pyrophosphate-binding protein [Gemmataceae bacterium]